MLWRSSQVLRISARKIRTFPCVPAVCKIRTNLGVRTASCAGRMNKSEVRGVLNQEAASHAWSQVREVRSRIWLDDLVFNPNGRTSVDEDYSSADSNASDNAAFNAAIDQLTRLQPNCESIRKSMSSTKSTSIVNTIKYLERSGLTLEQVEKLSVIHVAGTKGKGSTCALTESILRQYGVRTGFFSSPHIASTNERIRINGDPISKRKFTHYFWKVYNSLIDQRLYDGDMPSFFMFLTIVGFHVFVEEPIDVAILEVGLGGEMDCTNILRNVRTAGITSLALEHTEILGNTLEQIAWQKAGIIKPGANVYTHVTQPQCLEVIRKRAAMSNANVIVVPTPEEFFQSSYCKEWNDCVRLNGTLAAQLAYDWLRQSTGPLHRDYVVNDRRISPEVLTGLSQAHWPGRCQLVEYANLRLHLDGAHTVESIRICCEWFQKRTKGSKNPKILVFNRTGDSDTRPIQSELLHAVDFDMICFVPNLATSNQNDPNQTTMYCSADKQRQRAKTIASNWNQLCESVGRVNRGRMYDTVCDAFIAVRERYSYNIELDVLVTGSIHLLGATISALNDLYHESSAATTMASTAINGHT